MKNSNDLLNSYQRRDLETKLLTDLEKALENEYENVRFSYDIMGYPNEISIEVWRDGYCYQQGKRMFSIWSLLDENGNIQKLNIYKG